MQRDANATVVDTVQTVFRAAETWPLLVPPLIVLGVGKLLPFSHLSDALNIESEGAVSSEDRRREV
jgi:fumarate reductase subunit D